MTTKTMCGPKCGCQKCYEMHGNGPMVTNKMNPITTCPHCGAEDYDPEYCDFLCDTRFYPKTNTFIQSRLCAERKKSQKLKAEVDRLDKERRELSRELHLWEMGMYHKPKMQAKIDELKSEVERLIKQIKRVVEIAEYYQHDIRALCIGDADTQEKIAFTLKVMKSTP